MDTNPRVVDLLNGLLATEILAVNQYLTHARMCESWGFDALAVKLRQASTDELEDAEAIMDRVLQLGGLPRLDGLAGIEVGGTVAEQLELAHALETRASADVRAAVAACEEEGDQGTGTLLRTMLLDEEAQLDWVRAQLDLIATLGEANYLAQQLRP